MARSSPRGSQTLMSAGLDQPVRSEEGLREVLRVGLAVRGRVVPAWVEAVATALLGTGFVELTVMILAPEGPSPASHAPRPGIWRAFQRADLALQRVIRPGSADPTAVADIDALPCPVAFGPAEGLDLIFNAAGISEVGSLSKFGGAPVWWFDHDGHEGWPAGASGYPETLAGRSATSCRLLGFSADGAPPYVLRRASMSTHPLCAAENRVQLLWKSVPLLVQKARELWLNGDVVAESQERLERQESPGPDQLRFAQLGLVLAGHALRAARFILKRLLYREQWFLLLARGAEDDQVPQVSERFSDALRPALRLIPPADRYWADPYLLPGGDDRLIMVEEYMNEPGRGRIALIRLDRSDRVAEVRTVLEEQCHLSYPCVFAFGGQLYMVPESSEFERVDLYRCTDYPWVWKWERTLLDGIRACDSTIFEHDGRWWLFATVFDEPWLTPRDSMHVFFSDDPVDGVWSSHPGNPCVCDVHRARPAGPPFVRDGKLFRPGQDCSRGYGYGISISEVTALTEARYEERAVEFIGPDWPEAVATHTLALGDRTTIVDCMRWVPRRRSSDSQETGQAS